MQADKGDGRSVDGGVEGMSSLPASDSECCNVPHEDPIISWFARCANQNKRLRMSDNAPRETDDGKWDTVCPRLF